MITIKQKEGVRQYQYVIVFSSAAIEATIIMTQIDNLQPIKVTVKPT